MPSSDRVLLIVLSQLFFLSGCAALPKTTVATIDGRDIEFLLSRRDGPTVVFDNGLGGCLNWWSRVYPEIANETTVLTYNRAGYGKSAPTSGTHDSVQVVEELRCLLRSLDLAPPYVLVGHSLGGLHMQYFTRRYPEEVAAMVLIDSTHPLQCTGDGAPENWPWWLRLLFNVGLTDTALAEFRAATRSGEAVLALPPPENVQVTLVSASRPQKPKTRIGIDAQSKRKDLARIWPNARQVWVDCGHAIPLEAPQAVVQAIREALTAIRTSATDHFPSDDSGSRD